MANVIRLDRQAAAQEATSADLGALLLAAGTLRELAHRMRGRISSEGRHGELYDELLAACDAHEMGTPASLARVAEELLRG